MMPTRRVDFMKGIENGFLKRDFLNPLEPKSGCYSGFSGRSIGPETFERLEVAGQQVEQLIFGEPFGFQGLGNGFPRGDFLVDFSERTER